MKLAIQFGEVEKIQFQPSQDGNSDFAIVEFISIEAAEAAKERLGKGGFGVVRHVIEIKSQFNAAWKELNYETPEEIEMVNKEIEIMNKIYVIVKNSNSSSFIHIVQPLGLIIDGENHKAFLVMEYCSGGDLQQYINDMINKGTLISDDKFWEIIGQLGSSIFQLHSHGIIHGDLKPSNVLLTSDFRIKLADFGSARELQEGKTSITLLAGTNLYLAPEIHIAGIQNLKKKQKFSVDIWACGIMLYELLAQHHPFTFGWTNIPQQEFIRRVIYDNPPELPNHYPENMRNLIKAMLVKNPDHRITAEQIMNVPEVIASLAKK
ncbi:MAG: putative NEK protein kinase [Streblomastix strix]|uniref:Putative NEK protein kinase n=1 Tax=Streblomastix strix TaxID=222440 RepID=A0A5J4UYK5_9EUKA|nr:MAG: putative NEK protein kinase [Streblomastix strix]